MKEAQKALPPRKHFRVLIQSSGSRAKVIAGTILQATGWQQATHQGYSKEKMRGPHTHWISTGSVLTTFPATSFRTYMKSLRSYSSEVLLKSIHLQPKVLCLGKRVVGEFRPCFASSCQTSRHQLLASVYSVSIPNPSTLSTEAGK